MVDGGWWMVDDYALPPVTKLVDICPLERFAFMKDPDG
jgi:hypothetical protein